MLYPIYPQPYGSGFAIHVKRDFHRNYGRPNLDTPRFGGRKRLPTSIGGAMIHVAGLRRE
jgi:hypothetical protein